MNEFDLYYVRDTWRAEILENGNWAPSTLAVTIDNHTRPAAVTECSPFCHMHKHTQSLRCDFALLDGANYCHNETLEQSCTNTTPIKNNARKDFGKMFNIITTVTITAVLTEWLGGWS